MGIPLRRGRFFTEQDVAGAPLVAVVNDVLAARVFPNEDPIGKRVHVDFFDQSFEIVGVVGAVKQFGLDATADDRQMYMPFAQVPDRLMPTLGKNTSVVVRTVVPPESIVGAVRQAVRTADPQQVMYGERTMQEMLDGTMALRQFSMTLLTVFAMLALFLACIGVYGVMSSLTGERTHRDRRSDGTRRESRPDPSRRRGAGRAARSGRRGARPSRRVAVVALADESVVRRDADGSDHARGRGAGAHACRGVCVLSPGAACRRR